MYNNKLAIAAKVNGRVLREFDGNTVRMPFGSEWSLLIKNLNSVRVQVKVSIDGTDATDGTWLVIQPNSEMDLQRFIKNGNFDKGNAFKFIERTDSVEQARGIKIDDGLIRVEFQFEKPYQSGLLWNNHWYGGRSPSITDAWYSSYSGVTGSVLTNSVETYSANASGALRSASVNNVSSHNVEAQSAEVNEAGITVPGSENNQKFVQASWFPVESESHVMIMKIVGESAGQKVVEAVTVKSKPKCSTCHKVNKANAKFCSNCGTSLTIF